MYIGCEKLGYKTYNKHWEGKVCKQVMHTNFYEHIFFLSNEKCLSLNWNEKYIYKYNWLFNLREP